MPQFNITSYDYTAALAAVKTLSSNQIIANICDRFETTIGWCVDRKTSADEMDVLTLIKRFNTSMKDFNAEKALESFDGLYRALPKYVGFTINAGPSQLAEIYRAMLCQLEDDHDFGIFERGCHNNDHYFQVYDKLGCVVGNVRVGACQFYNSLSDMDKEFWGNFIKVISKLKDLYCYAFKGNAYNMNLVYRGYKKQVAALISFSKKLENEIGYANVSKDTKALAIVINFIYDNYHDYHK